MDEETIEKTVCRIEEDEKISPCKPWYEELEEYNKSLDPEVHQKIEAIMKAIRKRKGIETKGGREHAVSQDSQTQEVVRSRGVFKFSDKLSG